jgi:hypothetical protein
MKKTTFFTLFTTILFLLASTFPIVVYAQDNTVNPTIMRMDDAVVNNLSLKNLAFNLQPTIFINKEDRFLYGAEDYLVVECEISQISQLYIQDNIYNTVQLLKIKLQEPTDELNLNLALLPSFPQLQYVQLVYLYDVCKNGEEDCLPKKAQNSILPGNFHVTVVYSLEIPG